MLGVGSWITRQQRRSLYVPTSGGNPTMFTLTSAPYNGVADSRIVTDGAVAIGTPTAFTSATAAFTPADVGKTITIVDAGAASAGTLHITTIAARVSTDAVTLAAGVLRTVTGSRTSIGTDNTAAINAMFAAWYAAGGGSCYIPTPPVDRQYLVVGQIVWPNDGLNHPYGGPNYGPAQPSMRLFGDVADWPILPATPVRGGLDLQFNGATAKLISYGRGWLEIDHLVLCDNGQSTTPFGLSTGTVLDIHQTLINGNPHKTLTACDQDFWIAGGTNTTTVINDPTSPFQGYGSRIERNMFNHMRRIVLGRAYCNAFICDKNWVLYCGSNLADGACIEFDAGGPSNHVIQGGSIRGNIIECGSYPRPVKLLNTSKMRCENEFFDPTATTLSYYYLDPVVTEAKYNLIIVGEIDPTVQTAIVNSDANWRNTIINPVPVNGLFTGNPTGATTVISEGIRTSNLGVNNLNDFGTGAGVMGLKMATVEPTTNPALGVLLFVSSAGALVGRNSAGTLTTLIAADTTVATVTVAPTSAAIITTNTQQYVATARNSGGFVIPGATFTWASLQTGIATVNGSGLATGVSAGTATIRATSGGINGDATAIVSAAGIVTDTFTRTSAVSLGTSDTGHVWTAYSGTWGTNGTQAYMVTVGTSNKSAAVLACASANGTLTCTIATLVSGTRLITRASGIDDYILTDIAPAGINVYKRVAGTDTSIGSSGVSPASGDIFKVIMSGDQITIQRNGGTIIGPLTETAGQTNANHGIGAADAATDARFDDWDFR